MVRISDYVLWMVHLRFKKVSGKWVNDSTTKALDNNGFCHFKIWENVGDGSWGFAEPTGVYDLNKTGRVQIVAY